MSPGSGSNLPNSHSSTPNALDANSRKGSAETASRRCASVGQSPSLLASLSESKESWRALGALLQAQAQARADGRAPWATYCAYKGPKPTTIPCEMRDNSLHARPVGLAPLCSALPQTDTRLTRCCVFSQAEKQKNLPVQANRIMLDMNAVR